MTATKIKECNCDICDYIVKDECCESYKCCEISKVCPCQKVESINLTDRFRIYNGKYTHIWIECKTIKQAEEIKQQILDNQKIVERLKKLLDSKIEELKGGKIRKFITTREVQSILTVNSNGKEENS